MGVQNRTTGAARAFVEKLLGGPVREQESTVSTNLTVVSLIGNNPDRVALVLVNVAGQDAYISLAPTPSAAYGILITANGGSFSIDCTEDFTLPARQWFFSSSASATTLYVLEFISETVTPASEAA